MPAECGDEPADRAWLAALARLIPRSRWAGVFLVTPATLLAWQRKLAAKKYDTSNRVSLAPRQHFRASAALSFAWPRQQRLRGGPPEDTAELTKLGVTVAPSTVWEILRSAGIDPGRAAWIPDLALILDARAAGILAVRIPWTWTPCC